MKYFISISEILDRQYKERKIKKLKNQLSE